MFQVFHVVPFTPRIFVSREEQKVLEPVEQPNGDLLSPILLPGPPLSMYRSDMSTPPQNY